MMKRVVLEGVSGALALSLAEEGERGDKADWRGDEMDFDADKSRRAARLVAAGKAGAGAGASEGAGDLAVRGHLFGSADRAGHDACGLHRSALCRCAGAHD